MAAQQREPPSSVGRTWPIFSLRAFLQGFRPAVETQPNRTTLLFTFLGLCVTTGLDVSVRDASPRESKLRRSRDKWGTWSTFLGDSHSVTTDR